MGTILFMIGIAGAKDSIWVRVFLKGCLKAPRMKFRTIIKIVIDGLMLVLLMAQMGRHFWGNAAHEWIGAGMFALFIVHHVLNVNWYRTMFTGKYTPYRIVKLVVNILVFTAMIGLMVSGVMLSQQVFAVLSVSGGTSFARVLHMLATYWGFVLMALHLGLHWNVVLGLLWKIAGAAARKTAKTPRSSPLHATLLNIAGIAIAAYGVKVFINRNLLSYMLAQNRFVFLDYEESIIMFYLDYLAMMGLFIWIAHNFEKRLKRHSAGRKKREIETSGRLLGGNTN